jgi:aryl-alcohol dehydrogenase-like predicted oxidoreductase
VADEIGRLPAQVALELGSAATPGPADHRCAFTAKQVKQNLACLEFTLDTDQIERSE